MSCPHMMQTNITGMLHLRLPLSQNLIHISSRFIFAGWQTSGRRPAAGSRWTEFDWTYSGEVSSHFDHIVLLD